VKLELLPLLLLTLLLTGLAGCADDDPPTVRLKALESDESALRIALAWPIDPENRGTKTTIIQGVDLAVNEVNAGGGLLGRQLEVVKYDDARSINRGLRLAKEIADDKSLFAVIGHLDSYISVPTSTAYEFTGLITMNPGSTDSALTASGYQHLFRLLPTHEIQGQQLARHFKKAGYKRVLIYYIDNSYGLALSNSFESEAVKLDISISDRRSYDKGSRDHERIMEDWRNFYEFDAIFLAGSMPEGTTIVRAARSVGITQDIYGGGGLDTSQFVEDGGADVQHTFVISFFHSDIDEDSVRSFTEAYTRAYGKPPVEASAALGYDAVKLLAEGVSRSGSLDRGLVAAEIRALQGWEGATGPYTFDEKGDVIDKMLVLNQAVDGRFVFNTRID
jgi:branched-chain amino acid transport system substrate-binding protein